MKLDWRVFNYVANNTANKMRTNFVLLAFMILGFHLVHASGNQQIKYRIQCGTSRDKLSSEKINEIFELKTFTLPSGSKIYFSGGYFNKYEIAKNRLKVVKTAGLSKAFIRVFKYNNMLSKTAGQKYIEIAINKMAIVKSISKDTANISEAKLKVSPTPTLSKKYYSLAEIEEIKKKNAERKSRKIAKEINIAAARKRAKEKKDAEKLKGEQGKKASLVIKEPPVFKIMLGKSAVYNDQFESMSKLSDEIVYTYQNRHEIIYTVGHYENLSEAKKSLISFKKIVGDAKVVGYYRGKIISLKLANELLAQYNSQ